MELVSRSLLLQLMPGTQETEGQAAGQALDQLLHHYATVIRVSRSPASPSRMSLLREAEKQEAMCLFLDCVAIMPLV